MAENLWVRKSKSSSKKRKRFGVRVQRLHRSLSVKRPHNSQKLFGSDLLVVRQTREILRKRSGGTCTNIKSNQIEVERDKYENSKQYIFANFDTEEHANLAINKMEGLVIRANRVNLNLKIFYLTYPLYQLLLISQY